LCGRPEALAPSKCLKISSGVFSRAKVGIVRTLRAQRLSPTSSLSAMPANDPENSNACRQGHGG
jgi:hypothetical protein